MSKLLTRLLNNSDLVFSSQRLPKVDLCSILWLNKNTEIKNHPLYINAFQTPIIRYFWSCVNTALKVLMDTKMKRLIPQ